MIEELIRMNELLLLLHVGIISGLDSLSIDKFRNLNMLLKLLTIYYSLLENAYRLAIILLVIFWSENCLTMTAKNLNLEVRAVLWILIITDFILKFSSLSLLSAGFQSWDATFRNTIVIKSFYSFIFIDVSLI